MGLFKKSKEKLYKNATEAYRSKDYKKAFKLFKESADMDHGMANYMLARFYKNGIAVEKDEEQAIALFEKAARLGCSDGAEEAVVLRSQQWVIKGFHLYNEGKKKEAQECFLKAESLSPSAVGAYNLAATYGWENNNEAAKEWYEKAYERGKTDALDKILSLISEDDADYDYWMTISANEGDEDAQDYIAKKYLDSIAPELKYIQDRLVVALEEWVNNELDDKADTYVIALQTKPCMALAANTYTNLRDLVADNGYRDPARFSFSVIDWEPYIELEEIGDVVSGIYEEVEDEFEGGTQDDIIWELDKKMIEICESAMKRFRETDTYKAFPQLFLYVDLDEFYTDSKAEALFERINGDGSAGKYIDLLFEVADEAEKETER